jgi:hypothetical protein
LALFHILALNGEGTQILFSLLESMQASDDAGRAHAPARKRDRKEHDESNAVNVWATRRGAGTTPYQEKLDFSARDFSHDASMYHTPPPIYDWPIQAKNPLLYKPNPV